MKHGLHILTGISDASVVLQITLEDLNPQPFKRFISTAAVDSYLVSGLKKLLNNVQPEKAATACHQCLHVRVTRYGEI